jgi:hypothetical protein
MSSVFVWCIGICFFLPRISTSTALSYPKTIYCSRFLSVPFCIHRFKHGLLVTLHLDTYFFQDSNVTNSKWSTWCVFWRYTHSDRPLLTSWHFNGWVHVTLDPGLTNNDTCVYKTHTEDNHILTPNFSCPIFYNLCEGGDDFCFKLSRWGEHRSEEVEEVLVDSGSC